ncbi:MAG: galactose-1-phosphate uridylyltransferase [Acidobacteria bacterium]|nr:MAG: galactose-1-phosphate uridylyltransferase [Acidobacteriota bacterium]
MPELRHDPIQKRWVIIASERSRAPANFPRHAEMPAGALCPFCEGNESKTPPEILALRPGGGPPNRPGWLVRVVPNKFPALRIEGELERKGMGVHDRMNGVGAHEVIIETPRHDLDLANLPVEHIERVIWTYRARLLDLLRDGRFKYILVFKNYGLAAGASLQHAHSQIIATPVTPLALAGELKSAKDHYQVKERCLFCDILAQELESGERIVSSGEHLIALAPFASRFPFEIFIAPRRHHHSFAEIDDAMIGHLARLLKDVLSRIKRGLNDPAFNFLIHTIPNIKATPKRTAYWDTIEVDFHWHIEIMPRLSSVAGFEWGTGFYINPTPPEEAARYLRELSP